MLSARCGSATRGVLPRPQGPRGTARAGGGPSLGAWWRGVLCHRAQLRRQALLPARAEGPGRVVRGAPPAPPTSRPATVSATVGGDSITTKCMYHKLLSDSRRTPRLTVTGFGGRVCCRGAPQVGGERPPGPRPPQSAPPGSASSCPCPARAVPWDEGARGTTWARCGSASLSQPPSPLHAGLSALSAMPEMTCTRTFLTPTVGPPSCAGPQA